MKKCGKIGFFVVFVILSLFHAAISSGFPKKGGTLIWGRSAMVDTLDPATALSDESQTVISSIYDTLVRYSDDFNKIAPGLAVSWNISQDGKKLRLKLRQGVFFHDGTAFNAHSVVFSFLRQIDPSHPHYPSYPGYTKYYIFDIVTRVYAVSDNEVVIELKKPYAPFLHSLTIPAAGIVSPDAVKKWGEKFRTNPCGTGPFRLVKWETGERVELVRNEKYWGTSYLDRLVYKTIPNNNDRLMELSTGAIHVMDGIGLKEFKAISRDKTLKIIRTPGLNVCFITMNTQRPPFDDVKVRQAVNYAINKEKIVKLLYQGLAEPAVNPFPPTIWAYNHDIQGYDYNPEKARHLLKEAGYPDGLKITLFKLPVPRFYNKIPDKTARLIQANLEAVGITADVSTFKDWKTYRSNLKQGKHQMAFYGWGAEYKDPDFFLYNLLDLDNAVPGKGYNFSFFQNKKFHKLIVKAQEISDQSQRTGLYEEAQRIAHEQAPWVPLVHSQRLLGFHKNVRGIILDPLQYWGIQKAWFERPE